MPKKNNPNITTFLTYHENSLAKSKILEQKKVKYCCEIEKKDNITQLTWTVEFLKIFGCLVITFRKISFCFSEKRSICRSLYSLKHWKWYNETAVFLTSIIYPYPIRRTYISDNGTSVCTFNNRHRWGTIKSART